MGRKYWIDFLQAIRIYLKKRNFLKCQPWHANYSKLFCYRRKRFYIIENIDFNYFQFL